MSEHYDIEIRILSQPRYLCVVRAAVQAALIKYGFEDETCGRIMLAVDEAVTNVIRHGYDLADDQPIWVKLKPSDGEGRDGFTIVVEDRARQVEPGSIRGRDLDQLKPGGLGVHIIREVMDRVEYTARDGGGMRLLMAKAVEPTQREHQEDPTP